MPDVASSMQHSPMSDSKACAAPQINQILVNVGDETEPTLFDRGQFAVSVFPIDSNAIQKTASGFTVAILRSIDDGQTFQIFAQCMTAELNILNNVQFYRWKARLLTVGADRVRVRMK